MTTLFAEGNIHILDFIDGEEFVKSRYCQCNSFLGQPLDLLLHGRASSVSCGVFSLAPSESKSFTGQYCGSQYVVSCTPKRSVGWLQYQTNIKHQTILKQYGAQSDRPTHDALAMTGKLDE